MSEPGRYPAGRSSACNSLRTILPVLLRGNSSRSLISRGTLFGEVVAHILLEGFRAGRRPRPQDDECGQSLAELLVINADDTHLGYVWMADQQLLDLNGVDVFTPETIISSSRPTTKRRPAASRYPHRRSP